MTAIRVQQEVKMPAMETLIACRDGITRRIKRAKKQIDKARLKDIRDEVDFLIEVL